MTLVLYVLQELKIKFKRQVILWDFRICFSLHSFKFANAMPPFLMWGESFLHKACPPVLCPSLHQPPVWASSERSLLIMVALKPADVWWAYSSSSATISRRFTAGTQREVQLPLSRSSPAQVFSKENTQSCSHSWMWERTESESPGRRGHGRNCVRQPLSGQWAQVLSLFASVKVGSFFKRRFC